MLKRKLIVAGSRSFKDFDLFAKELLIFLRENFKEGEVEFLSGMAEGPDEMAVQFAKIYNIPYTECPANWQDLGWGAGFIRNEDMGRQADGLIAFLHVVPTNGTQHMIKTMRELGKPVKVITCGIE